MTRWSHDVEILRKELEFYKRTLETKSQENLKTIEDLQSVIKDLQNKVNLLEATIDKYIFTQPPSTLTPE